MFLCGSREGKCLSVRKPGVGGYSREHPMIHPWQPGNQLLCRGNTDGAGMLHHRSNSMEQPAGVL